MKLKNSDNYKRVFLKSSKSHAERLIKMNARALLRTLPAGHSLHADANGRIKQRDQRQDRQNTNERQENATMFVVSSARDQVDNCNSQYQEINSPE